MLRFVLAKENPEKSPPNDELLLVKFIMLYGIGTVVSVYVVELMLWQLDLKRK
jgi:hypothetical protein